jgi:hypothetical protein
MPLQLSPMFAIKTTAFLNRNTSKILHTKVKYWLTHKHLTILEWLASDKHSSLLRTFVNHGRKKFYYIWPRARSNPRLQISSIIDSIIHVIIECFLQHYQLFAWPAQWSNLRLTIRRSRVWIPALEPGGEKMSPNKTDFFDIKLATDKLQGFMFNSLGLYYKTLYDCN